MSTGRRDFVPEFENVETSIFRRAQLSGFTRLQEFKKKRMAERMKEEAEETFDGEGDFTYE